MADKPTSASTDDKKFEDMTVAEKLKAAAEKAKEKRKKLRQPFNPKIMEASTDDPDYGKPLGGRPASPGSDGATETIKPDSAVQMKRRSDGSMAKLKNESFMQRMRRLNQESPTKLVSKFPNPGTISDELSDKITKSKNKSGGAIAGTIAGTIGGILSKPIAPKLTRIGVSNLIPKQIVTKIGNKISDLFGK